MRDRLLLLGYLAGLAMVRSGSPTERDPYWQARAGAENLAGAPLARPDEWSWAPVEGLFQPTSPGWNLILGIAYRLAGFWGIFAISLILIAVFLAIAAALARRIGAGPLTTVAGLLVACLIGFAFLSPRATMAVQVTLSAGLLVLPWLHRQLSRGQPSASLVVGAAGFVLSAVGNLTHLSWVLLSGLVAAAWAVYWALVPRLATRSRWLATMAGAAGMFLGVLATPYGVVPALQRAEATRQACQGLVYDWLPVTTPGLPPQWIGVAAVTVGASLAGLIWVLRRRRPPSQRVALGAAMITISLPAAVAGLTAIRFLGVGLLTLAPLFCAAIGAAVVRLRRWAEPRTGLIPGRLKVWTEAAPWRIVLTTVLALLSPGIMLLTAAHAVPAESRISVRLPQHCRLFSDDSTGGAIALLRPDVGLWIDGRADYYGRARLLLTLDHLNALTPDVVPAGTTCVVLATDRPSYPLMVTRLQDDPGWVSAATEGGFTLWLPSR